MFRPFQGLLVLTLAALALSACGDSAGTPSEGSSSPSGSASSSGPASPSGSASSSGSSSSLTVEFRADGDNPSDTWTLECDGATPVGSSDAPDPAAACALLADQGAALFAAPAGEMMCTQDIKGMQRASVTGTVNGETVNRTFSLRDGCQISAWEGLTALLGPAEGAL